MFQPCPTSSSPLPRSAWLRGLVVGALVLTLSLGLAKPSLAQTVEPSIGAAPTDAFVLTGLKTDYVWTQEDLGPAITTQRQAYRDQLEAYRQQEKDFLIAQDQYHQLGTLDSIEQAVKATRQFLLSRDQVLHTYVTLLQLRLMAANGVELSLKTSSLTKLEVIRTRLKQHHDEANGQLDRPAVNRLADEFTSIGDDTKVLTSQVSGLLAVGQLQAVYDKAVALRPEIAAEVTATSSGQTVSPETTRSLQETARSLDGDQTLLIQLWAKVAERIQNNGSIQGQSDFAKDLNTSYAALSKTLNFYLELLKLFRTVGAAAA